MYYSGSLYQKDWGETEQKSFKVVTFSDNGISVETVPLPGQEMISVDAEFRAGEFFPELPPVSTTAKYRIRIKIQEEERKTFTNEQKAAIQADYNDAKIEVITVPSVRESRSEAIMHTTSLLDEVKEYGKIINYEVTPSVEEKVSQL
jgi:DNA repair exonuclease SbcCD nuclease subunit